ncbi:MAG: DegT/DnrJ/EryC1/StrS family aminotransferase [Myxococcota bacterium]
MSIEPTPIPLSRVELDDEIRERVMAAVESGRYILGPECKAFEQELAAYFGVEHCALVANATSALMLALNGMGLGPGDEVIVPSHTAFPTIEAIFNSGATPVFADTEETHTIDPDAVRRLVTPRTKALLPVHLFGQPCDMDPLRAIAEEHGLKVLEDCAQAHGARDRGRKVGSIGDAGVLSFYASKNLPVMGDGGALLTDDGRLAERVRMLRDHGRRDKHTHEIVGWNLRFNDIQAAGGRVFLKRLDARNDARRAIAALYRERLTEAPITLPVEREDVHHVYHLFVIETDRRDQLAKHLADRKIQTGVHYPIPNHLQPGTRARENGPAARLPHTEEAADRILSLPMFPSLAATDAERVAQAVLDFFAGTSR